MSNDYLEFKEHLEHAFNPQARAAEYMKKDVNSRVGVNASAILRYAQNYLDTEAQVKARIAELNKNLGKSPSADSVIQSSIQREKDKLAKAANSTRLNILNTNKSTMGKYVGNGYKQYTFSDKIPNAIQPALQDVYKFPIKDIDKFGRSIKTIATILSNAQHDSLSHDDLEHGWLTDLFKKKHTYESSGSTAGMPTNLPSNVGKVSVGTKQSAYTDQVRRLSASLIEYELKMNQAKANYEQYRKLYNDTKKQLSAAEKALAEATKAAATSGYDSSKSGVASEPRRTTSSTTTLYREAKGSTAGAPSYVKRKK